MKTPTIKTEDTTFQSFPKMARLHRDVLITEKIDGTNAQILITEDGQFLTGSRKRWITPDDDNFGFSQWANDHKDELMGLGVGRHFGEWWGQGIQRNYGLKERRFSLFNAIRWCPYGKEPQRIPMPDPRIEKWQEVVPACCHVVPVLARETFHLDAVEHAIDYLASGGSVAAPGFLNPEGIVVFHVAGNVGFKRTLKNDDEPKSFHER